MREILSFKLCSNRILLLSFLAIILYVPVRHASAQELSLDNFITSMLKNNPGVQKILSEKDIAAGARDASHGINDAILDSSLNLSHTEPDKTTGAEPTSSDNVNFNISYNRLYSSTGTRLTLSYNNLHTDQVPASSAAGDSYYQPSFTVKLTQPLLKNAGGIQDKLNIKLQKLNYALSELSSMETLESYITQLASLYIDWYLASRELKISRDVYFQALEQEKLTRTKVKRQVTEPHELLRAQEIREDYFSRWQQAKGRYNGLRYQIIAQMNNNKSFVNNNIHPVNQGDSDILSPDNHPFRTMKYLEDSSRLKSILNIIKNQQIALLDAKDNARLSDLNLSVGYTQHGINNSFSDSHTKSFNKDNYFIMLEYKHILNNHQANGNFRLQMAKKRQIEYENSQKLIDARSRLANLQIQMQQLKIALKAIDKKILLGSRKIDKEKYLYKIGKLDLFELLKDYTSHLESRLNRERLYTQNLNIRLKIGELLDYNLETYFPEIQSSRKFNVEEN